MKNSSSTYPSAARSRSAGGVTNGVPGPVIGPVTVGGRTAAHPGPANTASSAQTDRQFRNTRSDEAAIANDSMETDANASIQNQANGAMLRAFGAVLSRSDGRR